MKRSFLLMTAACALGCMLLPTPSWAGGTTADGPPAARWETWTDLADTSWAHAAFLARQPENRATVVVLQSAPRFSPMLVCEAMHSPSPVAGEATVQTESLLAPIPEASTLVLALLGTVGISMLRRRRH